MANFKTHLWVASAAGGTSAIIAATAGVVDIADAPWLAFLATVGGLLPDVDSDNSKPARRLFDFLAALCCLVSLTIWLDDLPRFELLAGAAVVYLAVRYPLFFLFQKFTVHRGVFHSLLGAFFFGLLVTCLSYYYLEWDVLHAWLNGLFIVIGFIVHLCLDELYSVDLSNVRIKKSFGTALKLFSYNDISASTLLLASVAVLYLAAPTSSHLLRVLMHADWNKVVEIDWKSFGPVLQASKPKI